MARHQAKHRNRVGLRLWRTTCKRRLSPTQVSTFSFRPSFGLSRGLDDLRPGQAQFSTFLCTLTPDRFTSSPLLVGRGPKIRPAVLYDPRSRECMASGPATPGKRNVAPSTKSRLLPPSRPISRAALRQATIEIRLLRQMRDRPKRSNEESAGT
jgi:hypothetical protein